MVVITDKNDNKIITHKDIMFFPKMKKVKIGNDLIEVNQVEIITGSTTTYTFINKKKEEE